MICVEELKATCNRLEIIKNNVSSPEEKYACDIFSQNLLTMIKQFAQLENSPEFKQMANATYRSEE